MSGFNLPPGVSARDIPGNDCDDESQHQAMAVLTLRDYFAAKSLQGMLACPVQPQSGADMFARDAYMLADAMLKAREVQS